MSSTSKDSLPNALGKPSEDQKQLNMRELLYGFPVVVEAKEFAQGRKLEIFDEKGTFVAALQKNVRGNTEDEKSYSLILVDGTKVLLPVPFVATSGSFNLDLRANEDIEMTISFVDTRFNFKFSEPDVFNVSAVRAASTVCEEREMTPEWQEFSLVDDQFLTFYSKKNQVWARVYKVPHKNEYILRNPSGEAIEHLVEDDVSKVEEQVKARKVDYGVKNGKFRVKGNFKSILRVERDPAYQKIPAGRDGILHGRMNGGRQVVVASFRELGKVKDHMEFTNEDNAGFNDDTLVVADGVGGGYQGALAADYAVETLLKGKGDLQKVAESAHEDMGTYVGYYGSLAEEEQMRKQSEAESGQASGSELINDSGKYKKEISAPDNVMVAVRFEGNKLQTMVIGDSKIYVIRGGRIVYRSLEHSVVQERVALGLMTEREALESPFRSAVATTMASSFFPDYDEFELQKGDRVLLVSDGGIMPDSVLIDCVQNQTVADGMKRLIDAKTEENSPPKTKDDENPQPGAYFDPDDGGAPVRIISRDNTTFALTVVD